MHQETSACTVEIEPWLYTSIFQSHHTCPVTSQVLITLVLLVSFLDHDALDLDDRWDVIDMFAGAGRVARMARQSGRRAVALDVIYSQNPHSFDINEDAGFLLLAQGQTNWLTMTT